MINEVWKKIRRSAREYFVYEEIVAINFLYTLAFAAIIVVYQLNSNAGKENIIQIFFTMVSFGVTILYFFNTNPTVQNRTVQIILLAFVIATNIIILKNKSYFSWKKILLFISIFYFIVTYIEVSIRRKKRKSNIFLLTTRFLVDVILISFVFYLLISCISKVDKKFFIILIALVVVVYTYIRYTFRDILWEKKVSVTITSFNDDREEDSNNLCVVPFYYGTVGFFPVRFYSDEKTKLEVYSKKRGENELGFHNVDSKFIISDNNKCSAIYIRLTDKDERQRVYKLKVIITDTENVPSVKMISCRKSFEKLIKLEYGSAEEIYFDESMISSATYNQRFMSEKFEMISLRNEDKIAIEVENEYGHGKTTLTKFIEERTGSNNIYITPINNRYTNINYEIFLKSCKKKFRMWSVLHFIKSMYFWSYYASFVLVAITISTYLNKVIGVSINMYVYIFIPLVIFIISIYHFPNLLGFKGHSGANQNRFYIKYMSEFLSKIYNVSTLFIIENFDRYSYSNYDDLFILMDGIKSSKNRYYNVNFIINSSPKYIDDSNKSNYLYNIKKHAVRVFVNSKDTIKEYLRFILEKEGFDSEEIISHTSSSEFHEFFDFRNIESIKEITRDKYCIDKSKFGSAEGINCTLNIIISYIYFILVMCLFGEMFNQILNKVGSWIYNMFLKSIDFGGMKGFNLSVVQTSLLLVAILLVLTVYDFNKGKRARKNHDYTSQSNEEIKRKISESLNAFKEMYKDVNLKGENNGK